MSIKRLKTYYRAFRIDSILFVQNKSQWKQRLGFGVTWRLEIYRESNSGLEIWWKWSNFWEPEIVRKENLENEFIVKVWKTSDQGI